MNSNQILHTNTTEVCFTCGQKCGKQIQDGRQLPSWNTEKSRYLRNHFTDFDEIL